MCAHRTCDEDSWWRVWHRVDGGSMLKWRTGTGCVRAAREKRERCLVCSSRAIASRPHALRSVRIAYSYMLKESTFGVSPEPHGLTVGGPNGRRRSGVRRWAGRAPSSIRWREGARGRVLVGLGTRTKFFRFFAHLWRCNATQHVMHRMTLACQSLK